jgi:ribonucleoside-diphosphate reductase alpha chain
METLKNTAIVFKAGGGMGYNFSKLRPEGDFVSTTGGVASGPLSFMRLFDTMTEVIKQGGIRRGANMGILNSNHPDIEKFITAKDGNKSLRNFNISVLIMSDFWKHYENNEPYPLVNPKDGSVVKTVDPRLLFDKIVYQAWESAEPGVIFFDKVNDYNPFYEHLGPIVTTNPCGEVLLYPNEPCNLGSINVWAFARHDEDGKTYVDWDALKEVTMDSTRFLDNVIDVNKFPLKSIEQMSLATRKIGLGVMGVANLLYELRLPYNSEEGRKFMEQLMEFVAYWSKVESIKLAQTRGKLPFYDKSFYKEGRLPIRGPELKEEIHFNWDKIGKDIKNLGTRNGYTTIIAPTGSISMIAGCSSGMEPVYSIAFEKNVKVGSFYYIDPAAEKVLREEGLFNDKLMEDINKNKGSLQNIEYIPEKLRKALVTAMDITPENHIRALGAFQKWVDSSISKTNNFPADATVEHMRESYMLAYKLGCKDVTVFRDTSIKDQVLVAPKAKENEEVKAEAKQPIKQTVKESGSKLVFAKESSKSMTKATIKNCPECGTKVELKEGCLHCPGCGWGLCM